jgi:hypothetical protein
MEFKPIENEQGQALVKAVPSHPDGHFVCDVLGSEQIVTEVTLRNVKPRHVRAVSNGRPSAMRKYAAVDPIHLDTTYFRGCIAEIPDPQQPGDMVSIPEVIEVSPDEPHQVYDAYQAVGEWWAQRLLHPILDTSPGEKEPQSLTPEQLAIIGPAIGTFGRALARYSREEDVKRIDTDYQPDITLRQVAGYVGLSGAVFSTKGHTRIKSDGTVIAREGYGREEVQIWPPLPEVEPPITPQEA